MLGVAAVLGLQREAGNEAVTGLLTRGMSAVEDLLVEAQELIAFALVKGGGASENHLTDQLFWREYPSLRGLKLQAGSPQALEWLRIRDTVVRPALRPRPKSEDATKSGPPGMVPLDQVADQSGGATAAGGTQGASTSDKYFVQDVGRYQDVGDNDKPRVWDYGSSGMNICNMTSLTMGLVSIAGEAQVRTKIIALLRSKGMHKGASVQVGGKWLPLAEALDEPKIADRIALIDLVTAAAIGEHGSYGSVTVADTITRVARESGLAIQAETARGQPKLSTEKGRAMAREMLASGKRVIAGTVNHYVYLIEVRDDGAIVHDPAGARVEPTLKGPVFLHGGSVNGMAREWSKFDSARRERAIRRVSANPNLAPIVNRLVELDAMDTDERKAAVASLAKEHPGHIATGPSNFYASSEFAENKLRLMVALA